MTADVAMPQAVDRGEWGIPSLLRDWTRGQKGEAIADNNHSVKSKSTHYISTDRPIAVEGSKVTFYYNDMVPNCAYIVPVAGKRYMMIRDKTGAIDIYEVVK